MYLLKEKKVAQCAFSQGWDLGMNLALVGQPWVPSLERCSERNNVVPAADGCSGFLESFFSVQTGSLCNVCLP